MLHEIVRYAREKGLDTEPGFTPKKVKWAIEVSTGGTFVGLVPLGSDKAGSRQFEKCPNLTQPDMTAGGVTKAHFLVETLEVIVGMGTGDDGKDSGRKKSKHEFFKNIHASASHDVPSLAGPASMLASPEQRAELLQEIQTQGAKPTDLATFYVEGLGYLVDRGDWHDWWRSKRRQLSGVPPKESVEERERVPCFLTGEQVLPAPTHEKIKGLTDVGGIAAGDTLVGFKHKAFRSFGFEQSANAAMSTESAKAYVAGLNSIILHQSRRLGVSRVAFWYRQPVLLTEDPMAFLQGSTETQEPAALLRMHSLFDAIRKGERPDLVGNQCFGLELSSNGGRVVVRAWWEGTYEELLSHTLSWFSDVAIQKGKESLAPPPKFYAVLNAAFREPNDIVAPLEASLWRSAFRGLPIPEAFHAKVLLRIRAQVTAGESITYVQAGLLKAFHRRRKEYMADLRVDENGPVPYQCGRLFAVLSNLQSAALGDVGAGVVERFYPAASSTPALVLGRLVLNAQNHLQKLAGEKKGLAVWFDQQLTQILQHIPVNDLPKTLTLEEQSLFALGYYQQRTGSQSMTSTKGENS